MKILHYILGIPPVRSGGLVKYALDLAKEQEQMGEKVALLIPGEIYVRNSRNVKIKKSKAYNEIPLFKIKNPLPIPMTNGITDIEWLTNEAGYDAYFTFLKKIGPDIIHIHSLMGIHKTFFKAARDLKIRMVFTTHDYFGICPTATLLKEGKICQELDWGHCEKCCQQAFSTVHLILEQSLMYREFLKWERSSQVLRLLSTVKAKVHQNRKEYNQKKRNEIEIVCNGENKHYLKLQQYYFEIWSYIDCFHFNSYVSKEEYKRHLGAIKGRVVPVIGRECYDNRKIRKFNEKDLIIGYLGGSSEAKGYPMLYRVVKKIWQEKRDIQLNLYFRYPKVEDEFVQQRKPFQHKEIGRVMSEISVLVVPSLCRETFALVVIEALSYGVPVIVTENVGAKILLEDQEKKIGKIITDNLEGNLYLCIKDLLENRNILKEWNKNICSASLNFSFQEHVKQIIEKCYKGEAYE